jgi:1-acyl-sn-glycerol-3-phosphate acyltransferase
MIYLYRIYQLFVAVPLGLIATIITALTIILGCTLGKAQACSYIPGKLWSMFMIRIFLLPVKVEGREHMKKGQSYVFCSNHQGAFDIFLIYGFLGRNFKWMMKQSLRKMPLVGLACEKAEFIFVDNRNAGRIKHMYEKARATLRDGISVVVFPEGRRTETGKMGPYKRGAFMLADELQLPVVPLTINGSYDVMSRQNDWHWVHWHPLRLTIHEPIFPIGQGADNIQYLAEQSKAATMTSLDENNK